MDKLLILLTLSLSLSFNNRLLSQTSAGIQLGSLWMNSDVTSENQLLNSLGFSIQKKFSEKSTISISLSRARTSGFDFNYWSHTSGGGGLDGEMFEPFTEGNKWFPNYALSSSSLKISYEYSPFNKIEEGFRKKIIPLVSAGIGIAHYQSHINILNESGNVYQIFEEDRILSIVEIKRKFDESYETKLSDMRQFFPIAHLGIGLNFHISDIWQLIIGAEGIASFTDKLDGITRMNNGNPSKDQDILYLYQFEIRRNF